MTQDQHGEDLSLLRQVQSISLSAQCDSTVEVTQGLCQLSSLLFRSPCPVPLLWNMLRPLVLAVLALSDRLPKESQAALTELEEVLSFLPAPLSAPLASALYDRLARGYREVGELRQAVSCYEKALRQAPGDECQNYAKLSETYREMGQWKQAVRYGSQAVILMESDLEATTSGTQDYTMKKAEVLSMYSLLAECEDHLDRSESALFWVKRSLGELLALSPSAPHHSSPEDSSPVLSASLDSSIEQGPHPFFSKAGSRGSVMSMDCFWSDSLEASCSLGRLGGTQPPLSLYSRQTGSTDSPADKDLPFSEENSPGGQRRHVSLRIRSRQRTANAAVGKLLQETWKTMDIGTMVRVRVEERGEEWVVTVWGTVPPLSVETALSPAHPWRALDPPVLASLLELTNSSPSHPLELLVTLFEEKKAFADCEYTVKYSTFSSLYSVLVCARAGNRTIRKEIVNDIHLETLSSLISYVKEVLSPQLLISGEKISLKASQMEELRLELTTTKALSADITAQIRVKSPVALYRNWVLEAQTEQNTLRLEVGDREVRQVTGGAQGKAAAEKLAELLMLEGGHGLALRKRQYLSGYSITIAPTDSGKAAEYRRGYFPAFLPAVLTLQRLYRSRLASLHTSLLRNCKKHPGRTIHRFISHQGSEYWTITVRENRGKETLTGELVGGERRVEGEETGRTEWGLEEQREEAVRRLFRNKSTHLLTRLQRIKGRNYQISVYSLQGKVEIRAFQLP